MSDSKLPSGTHVGDADELRRTAAANARVTFGGDAAAERARVATGEELATLRHHEDADVLLALLSNPALADTDVCLLLRRSSLPSEIIEGICQRREWLKSYAVKKALVSHPHTPRLVSLRLLRDLYLMDLVQIALQPGVPAEMKRGAEEQLAARLPQLPLGQKITLARRGPGRIAGLLLAEGHPQVVAVALENAHMTAGQILKVLAREGVTEVVVQAIAQHGKWSSDYHVRLALVRNPGSTLTSVLAFLPELTVADLRELAAPGIVPERLRQYLEAEVQRRVLAGKRLASREKSFEGQPSNNG